MSFEVMESDRKRICVLGGGGFLGSHFVHALLARTEHDVSVVDTSLVKLEQTGPLARIQGLKLIQASIREPGVLESAVASNDIVVSMTALCNPSLYNTRPLEVIESNFSDLAPLIQLCTDADRWLIHFSTCEVYGKTLPDDAQPLTEDSSPLLLGPVQWERWTYACAKQLLERLIWAQGTHAGLRFTIVRPFNVIGPRMDYLAGIDGEGIPRVLACFMRALICGEPLQLVDGGQQRRAFMDVADFTDAALRLLDNESACQGEILNIGNPSNDMSIAELAERMSDIYWQRYSGEPPCHEIVSALEFYGPGYDDVALRIPDIRKAERLLGWRPTVSLMEMLPPIIDDYVRRYAELLRGPKRASAR